MTTVELVPGVPEQLDLRHDLEVALASEQLRLEYQPKGRTKDLEVVGFEALVRWRHPRLGLIGPNIFIPAAEQSGQIHLIGSWVLREACREAVSWSKPLRIAINVSALQLKSVAFPGIVASVLMRSGLPPQRVELEITETAFLEDCSIAAATMTQLRSLGIRIAIDDFGVGYSNLALIQSLPFDTLKIDGSFVANIGRLTKSETIIRGMIGLAHALGATVTAEFVETEQQRAFLASEECDEIQGYLLGRPNSIESYRDFISHRPKESVVNLFGL